MPTQRTPPSHFFTVAGAVALPGACLVTFGALLEPVAAFTGLLAAAALTSLPALQPASRDWPALRLSFVVEFISLLTFGAVPAMAVAACGLLARRLLNPQHARPRSLFLLYAITAPLRMAGCGLRV